MAQSPAMLRRLPALWGVVLLAYVFAGCARPYKGPKTLGAIGAGLLVGGGATWIAGERGDRRPLVLTGFVATVLGVAAVVSAGGWMATAVACRYDPDCPEGEECREVPAPPGGVPYKQCVRRE